MSGLLLPACKVACRNSRARWPGASRGHAMPYTCKHSYAYGRQRLVQNTNINRYQTHTVCVNVMCNPDDGSLAPCGPDVGPMHGMQGFGQP